MPFAKELTVKPVAIADIAFTIFDPDPAGTGVQTMTVSIQVRLDDGSIRVRQVNLSEALGAAALSQLQGLAATIRQKAVTEILPAP